MPDNAAPVQWNGGEVLFAGATNWATVGRAANKKKPPEEEEDGTDLVVAHRLKPLCGVKIRFVAAGSAAVHCLALDVEGRCYTWGRNDNGQLGHGDLRSRVQPTLLEALSESVVVSGSCGKRHTAFVTQDGVSYSCGSNAVGQCGVGEIRSKNDAAIETPLQALVSACQGVTCGAEFTLWRCDGKLYAAGSPQYGVLGDGSTHEYNASDYSVKMKFDPEPTPKLIKALNSREITQVVAGSHHAMAIDSDGIPYTWGNGNYGRLGHAVQQDEYRPRPIESFLGRTRIDPKNLAAGGMTTFCTITGGMLFSWGNRKPASSDCEMYPRPFIDFQGWAIRDMSCGPGTFAVAAERSVILWGAAKSGELAKGPSGKRSCANPEKCEQLEGVYTHQVACGHGFTLFLVDPDEARITDFPIFDPEPPDKVPGDEASVRPSRKRQPVTSTVQEARTGVKKKKPSRPKRGRKKGTKKVRSSSEK